jgi:hypothetical protein
MASNGQIQQAFAPVLQAVLAMREGSREQKESAHQYLEKFQKSVSSLLLFSCGYYELMSTIVRSLDCSNRHPTI